MDSSVNSHHRSARSKSNSQYADVLDREKSLRLKRLTKILKKSVEDRNEEDVKYLTEDSHLIPLAKSRIKRSILLKERVVEREDTPEILREKCQQLADYIRASRKLIVYTGAGISTAAKIPDYRGPNGVWSQLNRNKVLINVPLVDLACAKPTFTHLALTELHKKGLVKHIVSQNCDGLHLRSGFPSKSLSEVHGNMFLEICSNCNKLYWRDFDVTEKTSFHRHRTGRYCDSCPTDTGHLMDTIVHFGEKSQFEHPYNWLKAMKIVESTDMILCLGTSLAVLRRYSCLWPKKLSSSSPSSSSSISDKNFKLVIVNLQWTPKDSQSTLKINGKCDDIMKNVCDLLSISVPEYNESQDPLLSISIPLKSNEISTHNRLHLNNLINQQSPSSCAGQKQTKSSCQPGWFGKGLKSKRR